jgi:hypothetical protein
MLAKYLKLGDRFVEELQGQSERCSPTEETLRAWQPPSGMNVRKILWKTLNAMGRTDAADAIIPLEEVAQTSRQRTPLVSQTSHRSETDSSYISGSSQQCKQLLNGEGSPRRVRLSLPSQLSPAQAVEDEKDDDSGNDSTEVNYDGKVATPRNNSESNISRDQSESNTPKLRQGEKIPRAIRQYRTKSNPEYTGPLTPVPQALGASSPFQGKHKQRYHTVDAPQTRHQPLTTNLSPAGKGIIGSARSEPRLHSFVDSRHRKKSSKARAYSVASGPYQATSEEAASEATFPSVVETFL